MRTISDEDFHAVQPRDIDTDTLNPMTGTVFGTLFGKSEAESAAERLVRYWKRLGKWLPLSSRDLTDGGRVGLTLGDDFPGLLGRYILQGDDGQYRPTEEFIHTCHTRRSP